MTDGAGGDDVPAEGSLAEDDVENMDREEVLGLLEDAMAEAHRKVTSGRVRSPEKDKVRQGWLKTLGYLAGQHRQLAKDRDLEELAEDIEDLREAVEKSGEKRERVRV
jgi:hypothetical protein